MIPQHMKPLLIIPPCPARWPAMAELSEELGSPWREDIRFRFRDGVAGSTDAFAVVPDGGRMLAAAYVCKCGPVGVVGRVFTRPEHRHKGLAVSLFQTITTWFDMLGGRRLYAQAPRDTADALLARVGFRLERFSTTPAGQLATMVRSSGLEPPAASAAHVEVRPAQRGDWPLIVELLLFNPGPDPRVSLEDSSGSAFVSTLELLNEQDRGTCALLAAVGGGAFAGLATVAVSQPGERTFAMLMPHSAAPPALRDAVLRLAAERGYTRVDFPMEALVGAAPSLSTDGATTAPDTPHPEASA